MSKHNRLFADLIPTSEIAKLITDEYEVRGDSKLNVSILLNEYQVEILRGEEDIKKFIWSKIDRRLKGHYEIGNIILSLANPVREKNNN